MGKKLARKTAKIRAISLSQEKKDRMIYADSLLEKWGGHYRHTEMMLRASGDETEADPLAEFDSAIEDQITDEVINMLSSQNRQVAISYWAERRKPIEIAEELELAKDDVRTALAFVREQVANKALS